MGTSKKKVQDIQHIDPSKTPLKRGGSNRREDERRKKKSKGYTYISIVGWMDRRMKKRRQDDDYDF
jgi:hypothetical protein